jgi:hypothetical protein
MRIDNPSISYIFTAINTLVSISQDYLTWQIQCQQENTKSEDISRFWTSWKANRLHPYYSASSGGGSRAGIIPLLEEFYSTRSSRADGVSEELEALENQLLSCLGSTLSERIMTLEQIPLDIYPSSNSLLKAYKKRITETVTEKDHNVAQIMEATYILRAAMESRNPVALRAALNPGWYSVGYHTSDLYREAEALLTQL